MPKPEMPSTPEGFVTQDDLKTFAQTNGYTGQLATLLWNKMLKRLVPELKEGGREGLDVQCLATPGKEWDPVMGDLTHDEMAAGAMVSRKSLADVQSRVFPHVAPEYGPQLDALFQRWVGSMK